MIACLHEVLDFEDAKRESLGAAFDSRVIELRSDFADRVREKLRLLGEIDLSGERWTFEEMFYNETEAFADKAARRIAEIELS